MVAMLDENLSILKKENGDDNEYIVGEIGVHNLIIACRLLGMVRLLLSQIICNEAFQSSSVL